MNVFALSPREQLLLEIHREGLEAEELLRNPEISIEADSLKKLLLKAGATEAEAEKAWLRAVQEESRRASSR